jgi:hypothetical protein
MPFGIVFQFESGARTITAMLISIIKDSQEFKVLSLEDGYTLTVGRYTHCVMFGNAAIYLEGK